MNITAGVWCKLALNKSVVLMGKDRNAPFESVSTFKVDYPGRMMLFR